MIPEFLIAVHDENTDVTTLHKPIDITTHSDTKPIFTAGGKVATIPFAGVVREPAPDYLGMGLTKACDTKWERGVAEHGTVFVTDPLVELYQELLDSINYCRSILKIDPDIIVKAHAARMLDQFTVMANSLAATYHQAQAVGRVWHPTKAIR